MSARLGEFALQLGPWALLVAFVCLLATVIRLVSLALGKRAELPDKDLRFEIGPLRITYTTPARPPGEGDDAAD